MDLTRNRDLCTKTANGEEGACAKRTGAPMIRKQETKKKEKNLMVLLCPVDHAIGWHINPRRFLNDSLKGQGNREANGRKLD